MTDVTRRFSVTALAGWVCLVASATACEIDEPATIVPQNGEWALEAPTLVSNSCDAEVVGMSEPWTGVLVDYQSGDGFQVELGPDDVSCDIDGIEFTCSNYVVSFPAPGFEDALIRADRTWAGEFVSDTEAEVVETFSVSCSGTSCELIDGVPCQYVLTYSAFAVG